MATKTALRSVGVDETPPKVEKMTVEQAAATGDHRALLIAMRERIAKTVSSADCPPRDLASLSRRLQDIAKEIDAIDVAAEQEAAEGVVAPDEKFDASAV